LAGETPSTFTLKKQVMFTAGIAYLVGVDPKYVKIVKITSWTARRFFRRLQSTDGGVIASTEVSGEQLMLHTRSSWSQKSGAHSSLLGAPRLCNTTLTGILSSQLPAVATPCTG
jgi:hypothetical protein